MNAPIEKLPGFRAATLLALVLLTPVFILCAVGIVLLSYMDIFDGTRRATGDSITLTILPYVIILPLTWFLGRTAFRLGAVLLGRPSGSLLPLSLVQPVVVALGGKEVQSRPHGQAEPRDPGAKRLSQTVWVRDNWATILRLIEQGLTRKKREGTSCDVARPRSMHLSLRLVVALAYLSAVATFPPGCARSSPPKAGNGPVNVQADWVAVAQYLGSDDQTGERIIDILKARGIPSVAAGSLGYTVSVRSTNASAAREILQAAVDQGLRANLLPLSGEPSHP